MSLYDKNVEYLEKNYPYITLEEKEQSSGSVILTKDSKGTVVAGVEVDGYVWYLGSCYDAERAAEYWVEQFEEVNYRTIFIVIGMGSGIYVRKLHEKYPKNYIILCEPNDDIRIEMMNEVDLEDILDPKIFFAAGKNCNDVFTELIYKLVNYDNKREVVYISIPNYKESNETICLNYKKTYMNRLERLILNRNTLIVDENYRSENFLRNQFAYPFGYNYVDIKEAFQEIDLKKRVAIIVSAGPSLDKNVHDLKLAEGKAFIIVVDTALKTVISAGIRPDFAVSIDPAKDPTLFQMKEIKDIPLGVCIYGSSKVMESYPGKKFFAMGETDLMAAAADKYGKAKYEMASGGSVANNAFSIAGMIGFKTFILVGQDLAYPNGKLHTEKAYQNEEENKIKMSSRYFEVEDIYGEKIYTEPNMDSYRRWFEEQIALSYDCKIIDATEGGVKIKGSEIMTLKDAIKRECEPLPPVDFKALIGAIEPLFNEEQREEIIQRYIGLEAELERLKEKLQEQKKCYKSMEKFAKAEKYDAPKYKKAVKRIARLTDEIESTDLLELVRLYENQTEYGVLDGLNSKGEEENDTVRALAGGQRICNTYIGNIERLQKKWNQLLREHGYIQEEHQDEVIS